jgi:predicted PurR-regulated permease PerM
MISLIVGFNVAGLIGSLLAVPIVATLKEFVSYLYAKVVDREPFVNGNGDGNGEGPEMAAADAQ